MKMRARIQVVLAIALSLACAPVSWAQQDGQTTPDRITPPVGSNANRVSNEDYPPIARMGDQEGEVLVKAVVETDGSVSSATVLRPSPYFRLNEASAKIVKARFRYTPAMRNGRPIVGTMVVSVKWVLQGEYDVRPIDPPPSSKCRAAPAEKTEALSLFQRMNVPWEARAMQVQVMILPSGTIGQLIQMTPSTDEEADTASMSYVLMNWTGRPVMIDGRPAKCWAILNIMQGNGKYSSSWH
jgi:TonB family protein